jgi:hypothetical protein
MQIADIIHIVPIEVQRQKTSADQVESEINIILKET